MTRKKILDILPSKKNTFLTLFILGVITIIVVVFFLLSKKESFFSKTKPNLEDQTILGLVQADTDKDGVFDWEETLWGTDKDNPASFDGIPDASYIESKKKELGIETFSDNTRLTETEKFAREFFSAYTALQAGQVDSVTTASFANALGQRVVNPSLVDKYQAQDVKISTDNTVTAQEKYYQTIKGFFESAKDLGAGNELDIVSDAALKHSSTGENNDLKELSIISQAYQEFGAKVMETSVPTSLQDLHLLIANSANNTSIAITNMSKINSDPVVGLTGLSQYQKYGDDLINAVSDLETTLF